MLYCISMYYVDEAIRMYVLYRYFILLYRNMHIVKTLQYKNTHYFIRNIIYVV